jgi:hypothetical protein
MAAPEDGDTTMLAILTYALPYLAVFGLTRLCLWVGR